MIHKLRTSMDEVQKALSNGVTVITSNKRLAAITLRFFEQKAGEDGKKAWLTPDVLPWEAWLRRTWEEAQVSGGVTNDKLVLSTAQEQAIWHEVISEATSDRPLQQVSGTVRQAEEAYSLIHEWRLSVDSGTFLYNSDSQSFFDWMKRFESRCEQGGWLSSKKIADVLEASIVEGNISLPDQLMLFGFDELNRQQESLLSSIGEANCNMQWVQFEDKNESSVMVNSHDIRQEFEMMARWVRQKLDAEPGAQIGVVSPELAQHKGILTQALDRILVPHVIHPEHRDSVRPYNTSSSDPLTSYPVIDIALKLIGLVHPAVTISDASSIIRSPFISGWEEEFGARSLLDIRLRKSGDLKTNLKTIAYYASQAGRSHSCPILARNITALIEFIEGLPRSAKPNQWAELFSSMLKCAGWADGRALNGNEYQTVEAWKKLLGVYASLELVSKPVSASGAMGQLGRMASSKPFQPQNETAPVQVLSVQEALGLQFDYLWVVGMHDGVWPVPLRPNAFIPLPVQKENGLPHANEKLEFERATKASDRLIESAGKVVISYPCRSGDELLRPSPMFSDIDVIHGKSLDAWDGKHWMDEIQNQSSMVQLLDDTAPAVTDLSEVKGGTAVFKLQASCPFRAFAELRLAAKSFPKVEIGLDPAIRGTIHHRVLEKFWSETKSHQNLISIDPMDLEEKIKVLVEEAMNEIGKNSQTLSGRFRVIEAERLVSQILQWLDIEKERQPFIVVAVEKRYTVYIGGILVKIVIDLIDELEDSRKIIIDYKTGKVAPAQWFGNRPEEPQLPLNSMAVDGEIAGISFGQVRAGSIGFNGVASGDNILPGVKSFKKMYHTRDYGSWEDILDEWRDSLNILGNDFRDGKAAVDPKYHPGSCTYCDEGTLCRINEIQSATALIED